MLYHFRCILFKRVKNWTDISISLLKTVINFLNWQNNEWLVDSIIVFFSSSFKQATLIQFDGSSLFNILQSSSEIQCKNQIESYPVLIQFCWYLFILTENPLDGKNIKISSIKKCWSIHSDNWNCKQKIMCNRIHILL